MPYYSDQLGLTTISLPSSSAYSSLLFTGPYSNHSSLIASNFTPYSKTRSFQRGYKPHLSTISEFSSPLRRIDSPKITYQTTPHVRIRPIKVINTADIDVSKNRFRKFDKYEKPKEIKPLEKSPSPKTEEIVEAKPNPTIRRDRATVRLRTIHKDTIERELGAIKSWRDNFQPHELVSEEKRVKKTPGEILKEKFLIRSKSKENLKLERKKSIKKSPSFHDICKAISSDTIVDQLNPGQPIEVQRRQSRRCSTDDIIKEISRTSSSLSEAELQLLDVILQEQEKLDAQITNETTPNQNISKTTVKKKPIAKSRSKEKLLIDSSTPTTTNKTTKCEQVNKEINVPQSRFVENVEDEKKFSHTFNVSEPNDVSVQDKIRDISQVDIQQTTFKPKAIITASVGEIEEFKSPLKAVVEEVAIEESPKVRNNNKKFKYNFTFDVKEEKATRAKKRSLEKNVEGKFQIPKAKNALVSNILKKQPASQIGKVLQGQEKRIKIDNRENKIEIKSKDLQNVNVDNHNVKFSDKSDSSVLNKLMSNDNIDSAAIISGKKEGNIVNEVVNKKETSPGERKVITTEGKSIINKNKPLDLKISKAVTDGLNKKSNTVTLDRTKIVKKDSFKKKIEDKPIVLDKTSNEVDKKANKIEEKSINLVQTNVVDNNRLNLNIVEKVDINNIEGEPKTLDTKTGNTQKQIEIQKIVAKPTKNIEHTTDVVLKLSPKIKKTENIFEETILKKIPDKSNVPSETTKFFKVMKNGELVENITDASKAVNLIKKNQNNKNENEVVIKKDINDNIEICTGQELPKIPKVEEENKKEQSSLALISNKKDTLLKTKENHLNNKIESPPLIKSKADIAEKTPDNSINKAKMATPPPLSSAKKDANIENQESKNNNKFVSKINKLTSSPLKSISDTSLDTEIGNKEESRTRLIKSHSDESSDLNKQQTASPLKKVIRKKVVPKTSIDKDNTEMKINEVDENKSEHSVDNIVEKKDLEISTEALAKNIVERKNNWSTKHESSIDLVKKDTEADKSTVTSFQSLPEPVKDTNNTKDISDSTIVTDNTKNNDIIKNGKSDQKTPKFTTPPPKKLISKRSLIQKANKDDPDLEVFHIPEEANNNSQPTQNEEKKDTFVPLQSNRLSQWMHPWKKPEQYDVCPVEIFARPKVIRGRHYPRPRGHPAQTVTPEDDDEEETEDESSSSSSTAESDDDTSTSSDDDEVDETECNKVGEVGASTSSVDSGFGSGAACKKESSDNNRDSPARTNSTNNSEFAIDFDNIPEEFSQSSTFAGFQKTGRITPPATTIPRFKKYCVEDFNFLKVLGKGSFGKVLLAELKGTDYYYAVKCLKKDVVLEDDDVECTLIERKVLALGTKHPYLCHLLCTFQTESHLFFVMEYLNGGDLMFHIQAAGRFPEYQARFYGAEIVSGLKFLHSKGIVYRDLKLDNVLLDFDGHVRIADFGMCKLQIFLDRMAESFCGTPDYMAPEIIKGQHYNQCVDWWSFGVLLYEMLLGQSPFSGCDEDELFWSICNEKPVLPKFLSSEATQVLTMLLEKDASKRLGNRFSPHGDIQDHVFFKAIDWYALEARQLEPPFKPHLNHPLDTQYFDKHFTVEKAKLTPTDATILQSIEQTQFQGFSYTNPNATDK